MGIYLPHPAGDFTNGGFQRQVDGTDLDVSPDNFVRIPVICDAHHSDFLGATTCSNNTAELIGLAEPSHGSVPSFLAARECVFSLIPNMRLALPWALLTPEGTLPQLPIETGF